MIFQLGGRFHAMSADTLNDILQGPANGAYTGNHDILPHEFWGHITPTDTGVYRDFTAMGAKASWVRNPAIRYFHRLLSTGLLSRMDDGTFQSNELHLIWAALHREPHNLGCYLLEHFHSQSQAFSAKISVGGMITPIANHLGIPIDEEPISRDTDCFSMTAILAHGFGLFIRTMGSLPSLCLTKHSPMSWARIESQDGNSSLRHTWH